jgi:hypothetical protein
MEPLSWYNPLQEEINRTLENKIQLLRVNHQNLQAAAADRQLRRWLKIALGETQYPANTLQLTIKFLPSQLLFLVGEANGATRGSLLKSAAAAHYLVRASAYFDTLQDADKKNELIRKAGIAGTLGISLMLLEIGQEILTRELIEKGGNACLDMASRLPLAITTAFRGQLLDFQEDNMTIESYLHKSALKSGTVFSLLAELGAVLGEALPMIAQNYRTFGSAYGMAFHLLDDLNDFYLALYAPESSRDLKYRYMSLPYLYAYSELTGNNLKKFEELWKKKGKVNRLSKLLLKTSAYLQTLAQATRYLAECETILKSLDPSLQKDEHIQLLEPLRKLIRHSYTRQFLAAQKRP